MYNANKPTPDELPTSAQLLRSTVIAAGIAAVILVTTVLPAEFGIDPTGVGRLLGLTEIGHSKQEHASGPAAGLVGEAQARQSGDHADRSDEVTVTLAPGDGIEVKLVMNAGDRASFAWTTSGGVLDYDTHGDAGDQFISYQSGSDAAGAEGVLVAAFDGDHGWYWGNETQDDVTLTLRTDGNYRELKRML